ncbi:MAG: NAD(P)/FAD-dependent oxidoreductase [Bacillota bacterium]
MKYVIIGNSAAAIGTVEGIRQIDKSSPITIVSEEKYHTYSRPLISYYLNGKTDKEKIKYRPTSFYKDNNVELLKGVEATKIDRKTKVVYTSKNQQIQYDKLMIATGSRPFVPPFRGLNSVEKVFTFYTMDDALKLEKALAKDKKVLIIGAGLIGLKCAEGIYDKVKEIYVVDKSHKVLSSVLDEEGSKIVKEHLEKKGIKFKLSAEITGFDKNTALFADGKNESFDILVMAVGVSPNVKIAKDAEIEVNRGILVDNQLRTSDINIYSAGDCSEGYDMLLKEKRVLALLPNAYLQGETAGKNMAGLEEEYSSGMPMNAVGFFGCHILSAGLYVGQSVSRKTPQLYKRLFFEDNYLKGFIMIGDCGRAGIYTSIIREKIPLTEIDFKLIVDKPQLIALNKTLLKKKLENGYGY